MPVKNENKFVGFTKPDGERIKKSVLTTEKYFPTTRKDRPRNSPTVTGIIWAKIGDYDSGNKKFGWTRIVIDDEINSMNENSDWGEANESDASGYAVEVTEKDFVYPGQIVLLHPAQDRHCYLFADPQLTAYGKLDEILNKDDQATCSIYTYDGDDTTKNVEVFEHLLPTEGSLAADTFIYLEWWAVAKKWYVTGVACD